MKPVNRLCAAIGLAVLAGSPALAQDTDMPFQQGEHIVYAIKKLGLKAGEATLTYAGPTHVNGRSANLIVFTAKGVNFYDEEKIFVDPVTFHPIQVQRDVDIWGKKEKIIEYYEAGQVRIVKTAGDITEEQVIQKDDNLDNLYGFIYRYRRDGQFRLGEAMAMTLPTQDVMIKLSDMDKIKAGGDVYNAFYMQSDPKKYEVWFDSSPRRIPLRINGAVGFGNTSMQLREYQADHHQTARQK